MFTGDITDSSALSSFVSSLLYPINFISSKSDFNEHRKNSSPYFHTGELFIKPSRSLLQSDELLEKANQEARKLKNLSGIKTNFLLFDQKREDEKSRGIFNSHFPVQFETDLPVNSFHNFARKHTQNSIIRYAENGFHAWKNNNIWKSFPAKLFESGRLLLFIESKTDGLDFDRINEEIRKLSQCKTRDFSLSKDCFATEIPNDDFNYKKPNGCESFVSGDFWKRGSKSQDATPLNKSSPINFF